MNIEEKLKALSVQAVKGFLNDDNAVLLDLRSAESFAAGFIPGSVFFGHEGRFAEWAATIIPFDKKIVFVADAEQENEIYNRLAKIGFNNIAGFLEGGFKAWTNVTAAIDMIINIEADELAMDIPFDEKLIVVDVRNETEYADGHVKNAQNIALSNFADPASMTDFEDDQNIYLYSQTGYRSIVAASIMKKQGIHNLYNVLGGWQEIKQQEKIPQEKQPSVLN